MNATRQPKQRQAKTGPVTPVDLPILRGMDLLRVHPATSRPSTLNPSTPVQLITPICCPAQSARSAPLSASSFPLSFLRTLRGLFPQLARCGYSLMALVVHEMQIPNVSPLTGTWWHASAIQPRHGTQRSTCSGEWIIWPQPIF